MILPCIASSPQKGEIEPDLAYSDLAAVLMSKSRHFQPTPVQTIDKAINTVNGVGNEERGIVVKRENTRHISFLSFPHLYWLLLVILNI